MAHAKYGHVLDPKDRLVKDPLSAYRHDRYEEAQ
jgi:hypothetical protein